MSMTMVAHVRDFSKSTGSAHKLLLIIASYADPDTGLAWPSRRRLAADMRVSERQVKYLQRTLVKLGELEIRTGGGRWHRSEYRITLARLTRLDQLRAMPYQEYLQTPEWQTRRRRAMLASGRRCQLCNTADRPLEVHHRTYKRLGREADGDLTVLCDDCHGRFHDKLPQPNEDGG